MYSMTNETHCQAPDCDCFSCAAADAGVYVQGVLDGGVTARPALHRRSAVPLSKRALWLEDMRRFFEGQGLVELERGRWVRPAGLSMRQREALKTASSDSSALVQGALDDDSPVPVGLAKPNMDHPSMKCKKFVFKAKKSQCVRLVSFASKTVSVKALSKGLRRGETLTEPHMTDRTIESMKECCTWLKLASPVDFSKFKKTGGNTCKVAFCPICSAFQAKRDGLMLSALMDAMQDLESAVDNGCLAGLKDRGKPVADMPHVAKAIAGGVRFVFATLTTPNVQGSALRAEEARFAKAFNDLVRLWLAREYGEWYLGYVRKLEVTYNKQRTITKAMWEGSEKFTSPMKKNPKYKGLKVGDRNPSYNTYNPHYHVLLAVTDGFFVGDDIGGRKMRISKMDLLAKWRALVGGPSITQVEIYETYKNLEEGSSATAEIAKYVAKDADYLYSPSVFKVFYQSLKNVKRMTFGGLFRALHLAWKDVRLLDYVPGDDADYVWEILYSWFGKSYGVLSLTELSSEDAARIRGMKYSEANDVQEF